MVSIKQSKVYFKLKLTLQFHIPILVYLKKDKMQYLFALYCFIKRLKFHILELELIGLG